MSKSDAIEVKLPPLSHYASMMSVDGYFEYALKDRERQLKAEIAAKDHAQSELARVTGYWEERVVQLLEAEKERDTAIARAEKAESLVQEWIDEYVKLREERDTALEDVRTFRDAYYAADSRFAEAHAERDQLKAELDELRKQHFEVCQLVRKYQGYK